MNEDKKIGSGKCGPGGWRCSCCGPPRRYRKFFRRLHKRVVRRVWRSRIERMLEGE